MLIRRVAEPFSYMSSWQDMFRVMIGLLLKTITIFTFTITFVQIRYVLFLLSDFHVTDT